MLTQSGIDSYLNHLAAMGASPETIRGYGTDLRQALEFLESHGMTDLNWAQLEGGLAAYLTQHRQTWAPKTVQRRLGTFRAWADWAGCPTRFLAAYRPPKPAPPQPHPLPEGVNGIVAMIRSSRNPRHRALCALTGLMGLRVDEAVRATPGDFDLDEMVLKVRGKGDKERYVPVSDAAWKYIERAHQLAIENDTTIVRLTNHGARAAISRHARNAGISRHVSSHDMRATFATEAYNRSKDLRAVQELLGHADAKTTQVYTGVSRSAMRAAANIL